MASPASSLLQSVVWPAVAGNVAWAALSVALSQRSGEQFPFYWERLCLLGVMAIYLILDWTRTESVKNELPRFYWIADAPLAVSIALLAIAAQGPVGEGWIFVLIVFLVAALGHLSGAWQTKCVRCLSMEHLAWPLAYVAAGIVLVIARSELHSWTWWEVTTTTIVVLLWALARFRKLSWLRWFA